MVYLDSAFLEVAGAAARCFCPFNKALARLKAAIFKSFLYLFFLKVVRIVLKTLREPNADFKLTLFKLLAILFWPLIKIILINFKSNFIKIKISKTYLFSGGQNKSLFVITGLNSNCLLVDQTIVSEWVFSLQISRLLFKLENETKN